MRILFLNRVYPPAGGATGRLLADLAHSLVEDGEEVTVVTSRINGSPRSEMIDGVRVERVGALPFDRAHHGARAFCFLMLYPTLLWRTLRLPKADIVATMTDPPLLLLLGVVLKLVKGSRLIHWAQDIYPEVAEELGVLSKGGWLARSCRQFSTWVLLKQDRIIVVGRCMKAVVLKRGLAEESVRVVPNWPPAVSPIGPLEISFRREHGFSGRFIVMYSGNLGWGHSFDPILEAANFLYFDHPEILFLFVGEGPRLALLQQQVKAEQIRNVVFLPSQPLEGLSQSLGAADLHLVSMHARLCGLMVPSKIYGILAAGRPCLFIGPPESEVARIIQQHECGSVIEPPDGLALALCVLDWKSRPQHLRAAGDRAERAAGNFTRALAAVMFRKVLHELIDERWSPVEAPLPQQIPSRTKT